LSDYIFFSREAKIYPPKKPKIIWKTHPKKYLLPAMICVSNNNATDRYKTVATEAAPAKP
jgi:hypothetical protein